MPNLNEYIRLLSQSKDRYAVVFKALSALEYKDIVKFKTKASYIFNGLFRIPYLKRRSFGDILKNGQVLSNDVADLYGALTFIIYQNADILNKYIVLKNKLDIATAVMQYDEAYSILDQIDKTISSSMTIAYYRLKLTRLDKGINACTQLYNALYGENKMLAYITQIAFKSASIDIPFEQEIECYYNKINAQGDVKGLLVAFAFPYMHIENDRWLRLLTMTSIIDLYEGFMLQLSQLKAAQLKDEKTKSLIETLANVIRDNRLERYSSLLNNGIKLSGDLDDIEAKSLIENYYEGNYEIVINKSFNYLKNNPLQSTIIDLYNRSCIKLDRVQGDLFPENSLADKLYTLSFIGSSQDEYSEICRTQLRNLCMAWYTIPCMRHLYNLYKDIDDIKHERVYYQFWANSSIPEIRDSCFFENSNQAISYLKASGYSTGKMSQIGIIENTVDDTYNQTYKLLNGIELSDVNILRNSIDNEEITPVLADNIASQLFDILFGNSQYDDAIALYVNYILHKPYAKIHIDKQRIAKELTDERDNRIRNQEELAAFYTMINADVYKRYLAYKRYLKQSGVEKASLVINDNGKLYQYFIGKVSDRSVLMLHVRAFDTDDDVNNERIKLCQKAYQLTSDKVYSDEITALIKEQEINTLAQQVNDSKIHVDVQSLISSELNTEKIMFDAYKEVDNNIEIFEQKNIDWLVDYLQTKYKGKPLLYLYEPSAIKYKIVMFRQIVLNIRDKFLYDPRYGLDKYLSARIRHGTLITQLRNHFLNHGLVTNKIDNGEYCRESIWTKNTGNFLSSIATDRINARLLEFTEWLDEQLRIIKEEKIQIRTEHVDEKKYALFDYSEDLMRDQIDSIGQKNYETFDAFVHAAIELLWQWTNYTLNRVRTFLLEYQESVLTELDNLQTDIIPQISSSTSLANRFRDAITTCRTEFQNDIVVVSSWFKPEQSRVRYFTVSQAVDTSLSVINKINQNALSFYVININDNVKYDGVYFNAIHDVFHDMMSNILNYEMKRPQLKGKGEINISNKDGMLRIKVSNPVDEKDTIEIKNILKEQQDFPALIAGGKTRKDKNSGCVKIYSTVMYTLGGNSNYINRLNDNHFIAEIQVDTTNILYNENSIS